MASLARNESFTIVLTEQLPDYVTAVDPDPIYEGLAQFLIWAAKTNRIQHRDVEYACQKCRAGTATSMAKPRNRATGAWIVLRYAFSEFAAPLRATHPMYDVRALEPNNMAHLLLDIVPLCLYVKEVLGPDVKFVFRKVEARFCELLDAFEIDAVYSSRRLCGQMVRVRGTRGFSRYDLLDVFDCPSITLLPHVYERFSFSCPKPIAKIYLTRRDGRSLLNDAEVQRLLMARGYEAVYMEEMPIRMQLGLAAQAKHVVAIHGAAMGFLIMNRCIESVIELLPPHNFFPMFPMCLDRRVKRFALLMPDFDERVAQSGWPAIVSYKNAPFAADLEQLEQALSEVAG